MKRIIILHFCLFCTTLSLYAQTEVVFSQRINNFGMMNPSYFNTESSLSAGLYYRNQWSGFEGAPQAIAFNAHGKLPKTGLGLGITGNFEEIGYRKNTFIGVVGDYGVRLSGTSRLMFGICLGGDMKRYSLSDANWGTENNGDYLNEDFNKTCFTASYGLTWQYRGLYVGASHFLTLRDKEGNHSVFNAHAEYNWDINKNWSLRPLALYTDDNDWGDFFEFGAVGHFRDQTGLGVTYRVDRCVTLLAEVGILPYLSVAYSYDINAGKLNNISNGSHEIGLRFNAANISKNKRNAE